MDNDVPTNQTDQETPQTPQDNIISPTGIPGTSQQSTPPQPTVQHISPPRSNKKIVLLVVLLVVILGSALGLGMIIMGRSDKKVIAPSASKAAPKSIDVLRVGDPSSKLDAVYPELNELLGYELDISKQVFEPLVRFKDINTVVPALATSWKNEPGNENIWIFKLKPGVKFQNGSTLTAESVKKCLDASVKNDFVSYFLDTLEKVEVVGTDQVRITTSKPDPLLLNKLTNILIYDTEAKKQPSFDNGTGPYMVKPGTTPTETSLTLIAKDKWHGGTIGVKELQFSVDNETALDEAIKKGTIDLTFKRKKIENLDSYGLKEYKLPLITTSYIFFNTLKKDSPLKNKEVRRAISGILDKDALIKASGVDAVKTDQFVTKAITGYLPNYVAPTLDTAAAKKILTDAGFTKNIQLNTVTSKANEATNLIAEELKKQLAVLNITVTITPVDADNVLSAYNEAKYDMGLFSLVSDLQDMSDIVTSSFQKNSATFKTYDNPSVDQAMKTVDETFDSQKRLKKLQDAHQLLLDDFAAVPYRSPVESFFVKKNINLKADNTGNLGINFWDTFQN